MTVPGSEDSDLLNFRIIMLELMKKMKNNSIVCNIWHFDNTIGMAELESFPGVNVENIKLHVDRPILTQSCHMLKYNGRRSVRLANYQRDGVHITTSSTSCTTLLHPLLLLHDAFCTSQRWEYAR